MNLFPALTARLRVRSKFKDCEPASVRLLLMTFFGVVP